MSRVIVCDRCQDTALLERGVLGYHAVPKNWEEVHFPGTEQPTDLCKQCYKEFRTEFLGVQKKLLG